MQTRSFSNAYNKQLGVYTEDDYYHSLFPKEEDYPLEDFSDEDYDSLYSSLSEDNSFLEDDFSGSGFLYEDNFFAEEIYVPGLDMSIPSDTNAAIGLLNSLSDEDREIAMKSIVADGSRDDIFARHKEIKQSASFFDNFASGFKTTVGIVKDLAPTVLTAINTFRQDPISTGNSKTQLEQQLLAQTQALTEREQLLTKALLENNRQQTPTRQTALPSVVVQKEEKKEEKKGFWEKYGAPVAIGGVVLLATGMVLITAREKK